MCEGTGSSTGRGWILCVKVLDRLLARVGLMCQLTVGCYYAWFQVVIGRGSGFYIIGLECLYLDWYSISLRLFN